MPNIPETPLTRKEQYLSAIAGTGANIPENPLTREEQYLAYIAENGSAGGGGGGGTAGVSSFNGRTGAVKPAAGDYTIEQVDGLKEALEGLANKETQDQIKQDTTNIMETGWTILAELRGQRPKRYGYRVKISEPDPDSRVEYLFDAVGMTPARMEYNNGDDGVFNYGDWKDIWFVRDNYACMVKNSGDEDYRLNPDNYALKEKDGTASDVSNVNYAGNAMSAIPLCWASRYQDGGYQYVIFCEFQYDDSYKAYAHTRPDGTISKVAYHAMFKGSLVDGKLRSIAGQKPQSNSNATQELNYAKANGEKWTIKTWSLHSLIADLLTLISKTTASQEAFGQGHTEGGSSAADFLDCGTLKDKGQFFGYSDTAHAMKVFHIENFWGDRWERVVGLTYTNGTFRVKMTPEGAGYNLAGDGYTAIGKGITGQTAANGNGWQRDTEQTEYGRFPVAPLTGSDATFETDGLYWNNSVAAVALVSGSCVHGSQCGARCVFLNYAASGAAWTFGASLSLENPS